MCHGRRSFSTSKNLSIERGFSLANNAFCLRSGLNCVHGFNSGHSARFADIPIQLKCSRDLIKCGPFG